MTVEKRKRKYQKNTPVVVTVEKRKNKKNTPVVVTVEKRKKKIPKKYASCGDSGEKKKENTKKIRQQW